MIKIHPDKQYSLTTDKAYFFEGKLDLNFKDYLDITYHLKEAKCLNCEEKKE